MGPKFNPSKEELKLLGTLCMGTDIVAMLTWTGEMVFVLIEPEWFTGADSSISKMLKDYFC